MFNKDKLTKIAKELGIEVVIDPTKQVGVYDEKDNSLYVVPVEKLKNLLVLKQEKPVIPQFVADWIESYRKKTLVELINDAVYSSDEDSKCFRRWFHEEIGFESNYSEFLARVWLDGYEAEKEKKYIIKFAPSVFGTPTYGSIGTQNGKKIMQSVYGSQGGIIMPNQYTRREIEEVGSKYMIFALEVTE